MQSAESYQAGALAGRLGIQLLQGDPSLNLFTPGVGAFAEVPTGQPQVDATLRLRTDNQQLAASLGPLLLPLTTLNDVHIAAGLGKVSFLMSHADIGDGNEMVGVGYALYDAERIYDVLTRIVLTAEGRG